MVLQTRSFHKVFMLGFLVLTSLGLAGCEESELAPNAKASASVPPETLALMEQKGTSPNAPVLIRTYKKESELEIWKMKSDGRYALLKTFPMCRWSGQLGPKTREGDRQVPEGFYSIAPSQMNPHSAYYLSFNVGYPNAYDRAQGYAGGSIMVHGICSSAGCFSMTDPEIGEIYALARDAFRGGQREIQMQSFPFHMTAENFARYRLDPNIAFWKQLKVGADNFEVSKQEVVVGVCDKHYVFNALPSDGSHFEATSACPPIRHDPNLENSVAAKESQDAAKIAELISQGVRPIRTIYADGGQHPSFAGRGGSFAGGVSRPEALAQGPVDLTLDDSKPGSVVLAGKDKKPGSPLVQMAAFKAEATQTQAASDTRFVQSAQKPDSGKGMSALIGNLFSSKPLDQQTPAIEPITGSEPGIAVPANVPMPPQRLQAQAAAPKSISHPQHLLVPPPILQQVPEAKPVGSAAGTTVYSSNQVVSKGFAAATVAAADH